MLHELEVFVTKYTFERNQARNIITSHDMSTTQRMQSPDCYKDERVIVTETQESWCTYMHIVESFVYLGQSAVVSDVLVDLDCSLQVV